MTRCLTIALALLAADIISDVAVDMRIKTESAPKAEYGDFVAQLEAMEAAR